ncbi:MAG: hypothetical protein HYT66_00945 [Candidatus Yanofskybacteria bacterium]|nr:hypothetical protein [Candidatus Yanofskybacteria bacterium]
MAHNQVGIVFGCFACRYLVLVGPAGFATAIAALEIVVLLVQLPFLQHLLYVFGTGVSCQGLFLLLLKPKIRC